MALQDRTEPATPRKREEARGEGRVVKSSDLISAVVLLAALIILRALGPYIFRGLSEVVKDSLCNLHTREVTMDSLPVMAASYGARFFLICLPILLGTAVIGLTANVAQVGLRVTSKSLALNLNRLDPIKGLAKLVSGRAMVELLKSCAKITIVAYFVFAFLRSEYPVLIDLGGLPTAEMAAKVGLLSWQLLARGCAVILVIGILDYIYQRISHDKSLMMTKQEVKDEYKRSEGDPQVKGKIRQKQREIARRRMIHDVARADVVVTNPTHVAVALKYDSAEMSAPTVVAKGQRLLAQKIKEVAAENHVPIVENPPIARLLYKTVEVGRQIPEELFQVVAELLAYVYQMSGKMGSRRYAA